MTKSDFQNRWKALLPWILHSSTSSAHSWAASHGFLASYLVHSLGLTAVEAFPVPQQEQMLGKGMGPSPSRVCHPICHPLPLSTPYADTGYNCTCLPEVP